MKTEAIRRHVRKAIRAECQACKGSGVGESSAQGPIECQYCGETIRAVDELLCAELAALETRIAWLEAAMRLIRFLAEDSGEQEVDLGAMLEAIKLRAEAALSSAPSDVMLVSVDTLKAFWFAFGKAYPIGQSKEMDDLSDAVAKLIWPTAGSQIGGADGPAEGS